MSFVSNNNPIPVVGYNVGSDINDYDNCYQESSKIPNASSSCSSSCSSSSSFSTSSSSSSSSSPSSYSSSIDKEKASYEVAKKYVANVLPTMGDVLCLQEVSESHQEILKALKNNGFNLYGAPNLEKQGPLQGRSFTELNPVYNYDAVIALNSKRFTDVTDEYIDIIDKVDKNYSKHVTLVKATDSQTKQTIAIASFHGPGYRLSDRTDEKLTSDQEEEAKISDYYWTQLLEHLSKINGVALTLLCADVNNNPEHRKTLFNEFTRYQFNTHRSGQPTNVNHQPGTTYTKRELDFMFIRPGTSDYNKSSFKVVTNLGFDPTQNCSDHLPIQATIEMIPQKDILAQYHEICGELSYAERQDPKLIGLMKSFKGAWFESKKKQHLDNIKKWHAEYKASNSDNAVNADFDIDTGIIDIFLKKPSCPLPRPDDQKQKLEQQSLQQVSTDLPRPPSIIYPNSSIIPDSNATTSTTTSPATRTCDINAIIKVGSQKRFEQYIPEDDDVDVDDLLKE